MPGRPPPIPRNAPATHRMTPDPPTQFATLPRGGAVVETSAGPVQFGVPPETIKDTLRRETGVPRIFVVGHSFFSHRRGVNLAEVEFPLYYNYFGRNRRAVIVCTEHQRARIRTFMRESLMGPVTIDLSAEIDGHPAWAPDLHAELAYFKRTPDRTSPTLDIDSLAEFAIFEDDQVRVGDLTLRRDGERFRLIDHGAADRAVSVPGHVRVPEPPDRPATRTEPFRPPTLGVSILGSGHGFDPDGKTTGFVLWVNGRGVLVDPPVDATDVLRAEDVPSRNVDALILTHCHADHDGGTLQRALQADRLRLYTTDTIYRSFLRKAEAITGLPAARFDAILDFHPVPIGRPYRINGATFVFHYTLHSIPCIRFEVETGGKSLVYSSDTLNDPDAIRAFRAAGAMSEGRAQHLLDFPWHHDAVIHEAGVPPIHTQPRVLAALPDDVKRRLWVVHTTARAIPPSSGLRVAPEGFAHTLRLDAEPLPDQRERAWLRAMRGVEHFATLRPDKASEFLQLVRPRRFAAGDVVIRRGDPADAFYMILSGAACVSEGEVPTKRFGLYDYFGEAALVLDTPRTADVTAATDLEVLEMSAAGFARFVAGSGISARMRRLYANRASDTWRLLDEHPILSGLDATQRTRLQTVMVQRTLEPGARLLSPTEPAAPPAFLVRDGALTLEHPDHPPLRVTRGQLASDLGAAFLDAPVATTLVAATAAEVFEIPGGPWRRFLRAYPGLYLRLTNPDR